MSKCRNCGKHGLFVIVNIHTGLCSDCQKKYEAELSAPAAGEPPKPVERSIEIPTVYIGGDMKFRIKERFEDVELQRPDVLPDFSNINCCDDVSFSISDGVIVAKKYSDVLGFISDDSLSRKISDLLKDKRPIFCQILGYDDETGEIHVVIAFYKIVDYDYTDYVQERDDSLEYETVAYF